MNDSDPLAIELIEANTEINSLEFTLAAFLSFPAKIAIIEWRVGVFFGLDSVAISCAISELGGASSLPVALEPRPSQGWWLCLFFGAVLLCSRDVELAWDDKLLVTFRRLSWNPLNTA